MGELDGVFRAWGFAKGGTGAVSESIASAARVFGAEIRCNAGVTKVLVRGGRATGVVLEDGTEIPAATVVSSLDPRRVPAAARPEPYPPSSSPTSSASSFAGRRAR
jgi:phytoene dehydrogenase-like protein